MRVHFLQATVSDKAVGILMLVAALSVFTYYTLWVVVLVSTSEEHV